MPGNPFPEATGQGWLNVVTFALTWRRTWEDVPRDFAAYDGERQVGRIYKRAGGSLNPASWYWVVNLFDAPVYWSRSGVTATKDEAVQAVNDAYGVYLASRSG